MGSKVRELIETLAPDPLVSLKCLYGVPLFCSAKIGI